MNIKNLLFISAIITIIILIIYFIVSKIYQNNNNNNNNNNKNNKNVKEGFILVADDNLYMPLKNIPPTDIKYQIPINQNQLTDTQLQSIDTDILRNIRVNKVFSQIDELDFYQFYNLLKYFRNLEIVFNYTQKDIKSEKTILKPNEKIIELNSGAINNTDLDLFYRIKLELISAINHTIIKSGYYLPYHKYQFFKIINSNLIAETIKTTSPLNSNYIFTITIAREFKYHQFVIYYDIDLTTTGNTYKIKINKIELIGLPIPKTIEFHENKKTTENNTGTGTGTGIGNVTGISNNLLDIINKSIQDNKNKEQRESIFQDQVADSQTFDVQPIGDGKMFQSPELKFIDPTETGDMDSTLFDNNTQAAFVESRIMNVARDQQFHNHRCYGLVNGVSEELPDYNDNPLFCKSYHPEVGQVGIWDAPCQVNSDCPFYQANKNYPNEFGKCDKNTGKCEMPLGIIPIGFTKYGKIEPQCYNCEIGSRDNRCCGRQANAIAKKMVNFKTPDYVFPNDSNIRKQYREDLQKLGLHANPSL